MTDKLTQYPSYPDLNELELLYDSIPVIGHYHNGGKILDWNSGNARQLIGKVQELSDQRYSIHGFVRSMHSSILTKIYQTPPKTSERFELEKLEEEVSKLPIIRKGSRQQKRDWSTPEAERIVHHASKVLCNYELTTREVLVALGIGWTNWIKLCNQYDAYQHVSRDAYVEIEEQEALRAIQSYSGPMDQKKLAKHVAEFLTQSIRSRSKQSENG